MLARQFFNYLIELVALRFHFGADFGDAHLVLGTNRNRGILLAILEQHQAAIGFERIANLIEHGLGLGKFVVDIDAKDQVELSLGQARVDKRAENRGEVSDALVKIEKLREQQSIAATRVSTLHSAINNADQLFRNGMATYLEVITAQSNSLEGELELASLKQAQLSANIELYKSLGGGWR